MRLPARFQKQICVDDHYIDSAPSEKVDAAEAFLALDDKTREYVISQVMTAQGMTSQDTDELAKAMGLFDGFTREDAGYLYIDPTDLAAFAAAEGIALPATSKPQQMSFEEWKAEAVKIAWERYTLPASEIEDDLYRPMYGHGATPEQAVTEHCDDFGIERTDGAWGIGGF